jgi:integrase/recombinase XerD
MIRRGLAFHDWPEPDRIGWAEAIAEGDIFDGQGPAAHWATTTRDSVLSAYGRWLGFIAASEPLVLAAHPADRLTVERLGHYLDHLAETAGTVGRHMFLAKLRDAIRVMFPAKMPLHLPRLVARLERECQPRSLAARVVTTPRLTALGKKLMKQAVSTDGKITDAVSFRDGLMIGLLALRPVRRRTFSLIRARTHLCQLGDEWRMSFEGSETKSGRPFEASVPERIVPFLERYLCEIRPMFLGANHHDGLWASTKGRPLTDKAIYSIVIKRTRDAFGQPVNPHLFRACAATTIALLDPGRIGIARDLLAHVSLVTTHAHYIKASSIAASRLYANVLAELRLSSEFLISGANRHAPRRPGSQAEDAMPARWVPPSQRRRKSLHGRSAESRKQRDPMAAFRDAQ